MGRMGRVRRTCANSSHFAASFYFILAFLFFFLVRCRRDRKLICVTRHSLQMHVIVLLFPLLLWSGVFFIKPPYQAPTHVGSCRHFTACRTDIKWHRVRVPLFPCKLPCRSKRTHRFCSFPIERGARLELEHSGSTLIVDWQMIDKISRLDGFAPLHTSSSSQPAKSCGLYSTPHGVIKELKIIRPPNARALPAECVSAGGWKDSTEIKHPIVTLKQNSYKTDGRIVDRF